MTHGYEKVLAPANEYHPQSIEVRNIETQVQDSIVYVTWASNEELYRQAIAGELASTPSDTICTVAVSNGLCCWIDIYGLDEYGNESCLLHACQPYQTYSSNGWPQNSYCMIRSSNTQSFIGVFQILNDGTTFYILSDALVTPNNIGPFPEPTANALIPPDGQHVVVGMSVSVSGDYCFVREQYWKREESSYSLAAKETRNISYTMTTGMTQTSTSLEEVSAQVGVSASAGWGPVSATVSASLSTTSSTSQELTVTEERTEYYSNTITNDTENHVTYFRWQLIDSIVICACTMNVFSPSITGKIELRQDPVLTSIPYVLDQLPKVPQKTGKRTLSLKDVQSRIDNQRKVIEARRVKK